MAIWKQNENLLNFLRRSPTPFHAVENLGKILEEKGFKHLDESQSWDLSSSDGYFVTRNNSALIAFRPGTHDIVSSGLRATGSHTDSPCLKIKPHAEFSSNGYVQLGVEIYGGVLLRPWFDRDLSIAGRVNFELDNGRLQSGLIDFENPVAFIPSLAIHLDRGVNEGRKINQQKELPPIILQDSSRKKFSFEKQLLRLIRKQSNFRTAKTILSHELSLYDVQPPSLVGLEEEFIASARLDNLLSCFLSCNALINSKSKYPSLLVCNDHEEVGSVSSSGAQGSFLRSVLERIIRNQTNESDAVERVVRKSSFWSIDNAHGIHPNYSDKHDNNHSPHLNAGPVIKINANQRYASNSNSIALFKSICNQKKIPYQSFVMRSDMACGSTIGPMTSAGLGIDTLDIGLASFGMHSIREMAGAKDPELLLKVVTAFYNR